MKETSNLPAIQTLLGEYIDFDFIDQLAEPQSRSANGTGTIMPLISVWSDRNTPCLPRTGERLSSRKSCLHRQRTTTKSVPYGILTWSQSTASFPWVIFLLRSTSLSANPLLCFIPINCSMKRVPSLLRIISIILDVCQSRMP